MEILHTLLQNIHALLALAAADYFADSRHQQVYRRHRFAVVIQTHIECFDFLRIIGHKNRLSVNLFRQIFLVLGLKVGSPLHFILKLAVVFFQKLNRLSIGHAGKIGIDDILQTIHKALVDKLIKERDIVRTGLHNISDDEFNHRFRQFHVVLQVGERNFRLYHPEFRRVALGIGFFRTEGRAEGVYLSKSHGHALGFKLPRNRQ